MTSGEKELGKSPEFRLGTLRKEEAEVARRLREKEKEMRVLLAQLEVLRDLIEEAGHEIQDEAYQKAIEGMEKQREAQEKEVKNLDELVSESAKAVEGTSSEDEGPAYTAITAQKLTLATGTKSIERLYELAYATGEWTKEESKQFFEISEAVRTSRNYDLADALKQNVDQTYKALQFVAEQKREEIDRNYNPSYASPGAQPIKQQAPSPYPTFEPVKIKNDYKPTTTTVKKENL